MNVVIIDNEKPIREGLKGLLETFCPQVNIMDEADGVATGYDCIVRNSPDLIFLDVEMDDGTGMDVLSKFSNPNFSVIFVTAHDKYAINAFRFAAVDFLLKPVDPEDLMLAVEKAATQKNKQTLSDQLHILNQNFQETSSKKIVLKDAESIHMVKIDDILSLEADGSYTKFYLSDNKTILVSKNLKEYESMLTQHQFFRTHHSFLANLNRVERFDKKDGGILVMDTKMEIPVSHRKKDLLIEKLSHL